MAGVTLLLALAIGALLFVLSRKRSIPKGSKLPPGPPGLPVIGNILSIPPQHSWLKFKEWSDEYGPIVRLNLLGKEHYVVSTDKIANDLLRERGTLYSSRDQLPAAAQLLSDNLRPLFLQYNDTWRSGRKLMHYLTNTTVVKSYRPAQLLESTRMLKSLIQSPEKYETWFERYASGLIFRLGFGKKIETGDEKVLKDILHTVHTVERVASPGAYLVDVMPSLLHLPAAVSPFKRELQDLHQQELQLFRKLLTDVREQKSSAKGYEFKNWEQEFIDRQADLKLSDDEGAYVVGTLFEAGSGTTAAAMMNFVLAMVFHPEWYEKLQNEVDKVAGDSRLPDLDDFPHLPITRAVVKEVMRWRPVTAGGVPHVCIQDDVYNGIFIPAGTNIHANQWAIHRDPELYPDPETFNPQRWLDSKFPTYQEPLTQYPNLHNFSCFGYGRRICPGQNIAAASLILLVARVAWMCEIGPKKDAKGQALLPPQYDYTSGFNVQPKWFDFELKARSKEREGILEAEDRKHREADPL